MIAYIYSPVDLDDDLEPDPEDAELLSVAGGVGWWSAVSEE